MKNYVNRISHFRHENPPPYILVGASGMLFTSSLSSLSLTMSHFWSDSSSSTHKVHGDRINKFVNELNNCSYFEASVTLGSNVDLIFHEGNSLFKLFFRLTPSRMYFQHAVK